MASRGDITVKLFLAAIMLTGCGAPIKHIYKDYELLQYEKLFDSYVEKSGKGSNGLAVSLHLGDTNVDNRIGVCYKKENQRSIVIDRSFWLTASAVKKTALMFHELAHCKLDLGHVEPGSGSLMEPVMPSESKLRSSWDYLLDKLFKERS